MSKFGIGVGEEFPIDEGKAPPPRDDNRPPPHFHDGPPWRRGWRGGHWFFPFFLLRIALVAAVIFAVGALLHLHPFWNPYFWPHAYYGGPYAYGPAYFAPHFPFGLVVFAVLVSVFAFGRHRRHHHRRWRHWHGDCSHREEA